MQPRTTRLFCLASLLVLGACAEAGETSGQQGGPGVFPGWSSDDDPSQGDDVDPTTDESESNTPPDGNSGDMGGESPEPSDGTDPPPAPGETEEPGPAPGPVDTWTGMRVGTNFWFLATWGENAWKSDVNFATTDDPWNPAFIADLEEAGYAVYRFMDFGGTNNSPIRNWSDRTQQTSAENQGGGDVGGRGIAFEWMFDLCNRMQTDCWISAPHLAIESYEQNEDENFFTELAKLAKEKLDPGLALYIEYSNETWNAGFGQARYAQQRGMDMGLAPDAYSASFKFHVYASSRMYDAFLKVYGSEINRVRWVVAGQLGSTWGTEQQVQALNDAQINLGQRTPDFYAISNYVGSDNSIDGADPNIASRFRAGITEMSNWATEQKQLIDGMGMRLISYEGGQHILTNPSPFARNPVTYDLYREWLDESAKVFVLTTNYAHSGTWGDGGAWGAKDHAGQPLSEAPKARAIVDWIRENR